MTRQIVGQVSCLAKQNHSAKSVKRLSVLLGFPGFEQMYILDKNNQVNIAIFGDTWTPSTVKLSGCPIGEGKCPFRETCTFYKTSKISALAKADVVVMVAGKETNETIIQQLLEFEREHTTKKLHRVLYWREPYWSRYA